MAWQVVMRKTRPNTGVNFESMSSDVRAYIGTNYVDTGKRVSFNQTLSGDGLQQTSTSVHRDETSKNEFGNDSTVAAERTRRDGVNTNNSISKTVVSSAEV